MHFGARERCASVEARRSRIGGAPGGLHLGGPPVIELTTPAEVSALLHLPLGVVKVLISDLVERRMLLASSPYPTTEGGKDVTFLAMHPGVSFLHHYLLGPLQKQGKLDNNPVVTDKIVAITAAMPSGTAIAALLLVNMLQTKK